MEQKLMLSEQGVPRHYQMFGLVGGAIAWLVHLLLTYGIAEFGCRAGTDHTVFFGVTAVAWLLLAASVATLPVALFATWLSYRCEKELKTPEGRATDEVRSDLLVARVGFYSSLLFAMTIVAQTIPIFYYLRSC